MDRDILLILASRVLRSMAAGALGIATSLYLYNVIHLSLTLIGIFFGVGAFTAPPRYRSTSGGWAINTAGKTC